MSGIRVMTIGECEARIARCKQESELFYWHIQLDRLREYYARQETPMSGWEREAIKNRKET